MSLEEIERRLRVLEDIEEIKKLKARYCSYCDNHHDPDGIAGLFTEDGVWDGGTRGMAQGRDAIRDLFTRITPMVPFSVHMLMNPIIEVEGDRARGSWYFFGALTVAGENEAVWASARYDDEYARVDGEWKCRRFKVSFFFWTPFDQGWVRNRDLWK